LTVSVCIGGSGFGAAGLWTTVLPNSTTSSVFLGTFNFRSLINL
jgi:hypothetical protein